MSLIGDWWRLLWSEPEPTLVLVGNRMLALVGRLPDGTPVTGVWRQAPQRIYPRVWNEPPALPVFEGWDGVRTIDWEAAP